MMTFEERQARIDSLAHTYNELGRLAMANFNAQSDLHKYSWNHRLPELIWQSAEAAENKHWANYCTLSDMQSALLKAQMQLTARPFLWDCEDGTWVEVVGLLPNGERTSTNEAQALQMYKAYCVAQAYKIPEPIELPF